MAPEELRVVAGEKVEPVNDNQREDSIKQMALGPIAIGSLLHQATVTSLSPHLGPRKNKGG